MTTIQTQGSPAKAAEIASRMLEQRGFRADYAHRITILGTEQPHPLSQLQAVPPARVHERIIIVIEPEPVPANTRHLKKA